MLHRVLMLIVSANMLLPGCAHYESLTDLQHRHRQWVTLDSTPSPAHIYLEGKLSGITPMMLPLEVFQQQQTLLTAMPLYAHQFRQDVILSEGRLPERVLFYMDIPAASEEDQSIQEQTAKQPDHCGLSGAPVLYFAVDAYQLSEEHQRLLDCFFRQLDLALLLKLRVFGYADESHTEAYNADLSLKRAQSVAAFLTAKGIDAKQVESYGIGEVVTRNHKQMKMAKAINRKVNFEIIFR